VIQLPQLPLTGAAAIFTVLMAVVLIVPILSERVRLPPLVGLVLAGMVVGEHVLGLIQRPGPVAALGTAGLLYLMFVAGLELDLEEFIAHRRDSIVFGVATFVVPMAVGVPAIWAMGFALLPAILLASCWASHTLLTYVTFRRYGTFQHRAVATSVGATILTDTAALLVLVIVVRAHQDTLDPLFWVSITLSLAGLLVALLWGLPRLARWFFAGVGQPTSVRFVFVLVALFGASMLSEVAGVEPIIGAFLAGIALNRAVPNGSELMERVEFLGSTFLIPIFLVSVGMLVDPVVLTQLDTLALAAGFTAIALGSKLLAAGGSGVLLRYSGTEIGAMFVLSGSQAAATLAAIIVALEAGLVDTGVVNAVILVILATCLTTSLTAERVAPRLPRPPRKQPIGGCVVVPVANPASAAPLMRVAAALARPDSGSVVPLTVLPLEASQNNVDEARGVVDEAARLARRLAAEATGLVRVDASPAAGTLHTLVEHRGTLLVVGWKGTTTRTESLFGGVIDILLGRSPVPLLLVRTAGEHDITRVLLCAAPSDAEPEGLPPLRLATVTAQRIATAAGAPLSVLTTTDHPAVRDVLAEAGQVSATPLDGRRAEVLSEQARPGDLVIVPIRPDRPSLHRAAERVARLVPDCPLIVAYDAGTPRLEGTGTTIGEFRPAPE
jgi:Kef-type K+ transport system membrane component KefB